jgi:hypothetical protein
MQCKDIPELPILRFLAGPYDNWPVPRWATWFNYEPRPENSVLNAMPLGTPAKLALAKMRQMIRKGLVEGCGCGCRGDFEITDKGRALLQEFAL